MAGAASEPFTTKSQFAVQSTLQTPRPNRFTRALPPRGSRDLLRLAEGGALSYEGARHRPFLGTARASLFAKPQTLLNPEPSKPAESDGEKGVGNG